jgi:hypothetical protein
MRQRERYCYRYSTKEASMYSYVKQAGIPTVLAQEAPAFLTSFVIAEVFYKFHSFTLECAAFLVTWYALSWVQSLIVGSRAK